MVAGEARRWSQLHAAHRQLLEQRAAAGLQDSPEAGPQDGSSDVASSVEFVHTAPAGVQQASSSSSSSSSNSSASARPVPRMLQQAAPGTVPIRVWVEYQGTGALNGDGLQRLYDTVNIALGVLQKFYRVSAPPSQCGVAVWQRQRTCGVCCCGW
jgi:hypothetical protein